ncbi:MAG: hypothetical protein C4311_02300 [Chloroflexota bacterium]
MIIKRIRQIQGALSQPAFLFGRQQSTSLGFLIRVNRALKSFTLLFCQCQVGNQICNDTDYCLIIVFLIARLACLIPQKLFTQLANIMDERTHLRQEQGLAVICQRL